MPFLGVKSNGDEHLASFVSKLVSNGEPETMPSLLQISCSAGASPYVMLCVCLKSGGTCLSSSVVAWVCHVLKLSVFVESCSCWPVAGMMLCWSSRNVGPVLLSVAGKLFEGAEGQLALTGDLCKSLSFFLLDKRLKKRFMPLRSLAIHHVESRDHDTTTVAMIHNRCIGSDCGTRGQVH